MKKMKTILSALVLGGVVISLAGCQNEEEMTYAYGKGISFNCASESHGTRAAYSGNKTAGIERIDWEENDLIRIYCPQASKPASKFSDYVVSGVTENVSVSEAKITHKVAADSLCWGAKGPHYFYAVYPSPETASSWVTRIEGKKVTGTVKAAQDGSNNFNNGMVMVANTKVADPSTFDKTAVFLQFKPLTTAIKFSITNGQTNPLNVSKVELKSATHPLSGQFSYNIGEGKVQDESITDAEREVAITKNYTLSADKGNTYEFTFFLRPDDNLDDLSIVVTIGGDTYTSKLQTESGAFTFESGKKYVINGVVLKKWLTLRSIYQERAEETIPEQILF